MLKNSFVYMLEDTFSVFEKGQYEKDGKLVKLKLSESQRTECQVFLPEDLAGLKPCKESAAETPTRMIVGCRNIDSFSQAFEMESWRATLPNPSKKPILVLNFANPVTPGGGVRRGARAQEEDLCRKSSLLYSLESEAASRYYAYNQSLHSHLSSDALILTPNVEVIKDFVGHPLEDSFVVSVVTCAAPIAPLRFEENKEAEYYELFYRRICTILTCAAHWGYTDLVLGAFGCGAFGNDGKIVSDLFYRALREFDCDGLRAEHFFRRIEFAVLDRSGRKYNLNEFCRNFTDYYRDEP